MDLKEAVEIADQLPEGANLEQAVCVLADIARQLAEYMAENPPVGDIGWTLRRRKLIERIRSAGLLKEGE